VCADYVQMCVEAKAAHGTLLPCLESEYVTVDMYMGATPDPAEIFTRLLQITRGQRDVVTIDHLCPRFKDGQNGNCERLGRS